MGSLGRDCSFGIAHFCAVNAALGSFLFGYELVNISSLETLFQNVKFITAGLEVLVLSGTVDLEEKQDKCKY